LLLKLYTLQLLKNAAVSRTAVACCWYPKIKI